MLHSLALQINLENFDFLKYKFLKFLLSPAQKLVLKGLKKTREDISLLKKQDFFEFTASNEFHISRGADYAITEDLQKRFDCLNNLHTALEQKNNSSDDLLATLEQNNINLCDLFYGT